MITKKEIAAMLSENEIPYRGQLRITDKWVEVTTEVLDKRNDYIQIYVCGEYKYRLLRRYLITHDESNRYRFSDLDSKEFGEMFKLLLEEVRLFP